MSVDQLAQLSAGGAGGESGCSVPAIPEAQAHELTIRAAALVMQRARPLRNVWGIGTILEEYHALPFSAPDAPRVLVMFLRWLDVSNVMDMLLIQKLVSETSAWFDMPDMVVGYTGPGGICHSTAACSVHWQEWESGHE